MHIKYHKIIAIIMEGKNWETDTKKKGIMLITKNNWIGNQNNVSSL